ncbi:MAG TPA: hypothetical protein VG474_00285, partial [Solirubrobacteraceae bacterium]|nr:hypothetical protein [Solirubrobacteraceae bacterium]
REEAREILAQRRFQPTNVPAPLRGLRERGGDGTDEPGEGTGDEPRRPDRSPDEPPDEPPRLPGVPSG